MNLTAPEDPVQVRAIAQAVLTVPEDRIQVRTSHTTAEDQAQVPARAVAQAVLTAAEGRHLHPALTVPAAAVADVHHPAVAEDAAVEDADNHKRLSLNYK